MQTKARKKLKYKCFFSKGKKSDYSYLLMLAILPVPKKAVNMRKTCRIKDNKLKLLKIMQNV